MHSVNQANRRHLLHTEGRHRGCPDVAGVSEAQQKAKLAAHGHLEYLEAVGYPATCEPMLETEYKF